MNPPRVLHGARSQPAIRAVATVQKRRMLRHIGLRLADLNGIGRGYLDLWARAQAKVELMDTYAAEHGWLDAEGKGPGYQDKYFAAINTARLTLNALNDHLVAQHKRRAPTDLSQYRSADRGKGA